MACGRSELGGGEVATAGLGGASQGAVGGGSGRSNEGGRLGAGGASSRGGTGGTAPARGGSGGSLHAGAGGGGRGGAAGSAAGAGGGVANGSGSGGAGGIAGNAGGGNEAGGGGESATSDCVVRVTTTGSASNDGSDWTQALGRVQGGIDAAKVLFQTAACSLPEVWVAEGTYYPSALVDATDGRTTTFLLRSDVAVYGGFAGTEALRNARNSALHSTVLSGDLGVRGEVSDNAYHVVTGATDATLDGFTITGGWANGSTPNNLGAGMFNEYASPVVANCLFTGNVSAGGGGMFNHFASPTVNDCTFDFNAVNFGEGGGMLNDASSPVVRNCTFTNNDAQYSGGAMSNRNGSAPLVASCTFADNRSIDSGGAVANTDAFPRVENGTFSGNSAYQGGAMSDYRSSPALSGCTFTGNSAYEGGALHARDASPVVTNCTFRGNSVSGMARFTGDPYASGGAIHVSTSPLVVAGCTFTGNSASYSGGAIHGSDAQLTVADSILWGDKAGTDVSEIATTGSTAAVSYCVVQDGIPDGLFIVTTDPLFVDAPNGDVRLRIGSPAIDAGSGCADYAFLNDQAGNDRWDIAAVGNVADGYDIGALEYQGVSGDDLRLGFPTCP